MNTDWFRQKLSERKLSQRGLAKLMNLDPAAVSLMLRGQRKMTNEEALQISGFLGVKVTEVLRQAGIEVVDDVRKVPIKAAVDGDSIVTLFPDKTHDSVPGPADCPTGTFGVQCRAPTRPQDGWLLFVSPSQGNAEAHLDKLCVVATDKGKQMVGMVRRGYRTGTHNLILWPGYDVKQDETIAWASSILWIKP